MPSSSIADTLARRTLHNGPATTTRVSQPLRRTYVTKRPIIPEGLGNRPYMIAALVGIPVLVYFIIPPRSNNTPTPQPSSTRPPNLDPAAAAKRNNRARSEPGQVKYAHPEHENPEDFKPAFGQLHKQKRVDGPPDGRNHQALADRARTV
ncbi:hypothetical protein F4859DRAFT_511346 [Xylaria cf. heliscus]|nr:hypothetical protein F4859DRAFT_511346 [Xylaria cf. heliscus]